MYSNKLWAERQNIPSSLLCSLATNNPVKYLFQRSNKKKTSKQKRVILKLSQQVYSENISEGEKRFSCNSLTGFYCR